MPPLDHAYAKLLLDGKLDEARDLLERQAPLSIFGARDHGGLLLTAGLTRKAVQYDIGNPLTAARMTRLVLSAAQYAPIWVLLREDDEGGVAFEYLTNHLAKHSLDEAARDRLDRGAVASEGGVTIGGHVRARVEVRLVLPRRQMHEGARD